MAVSVTSEEVDAAVRVLRRISSAELDQTRFAELKAAGVALFGRTVTKEAFQGKEVLEFLAEQTRHKQTLRELKKLHALIKGDHRRERIGANECGLNAARKATLEQIKQECAALRLESGGGLCALMDSSQSITVQLSLSVAPHDGRTPVVRAALHTADGQASPMPCQTTDLRGDVIDELPESTVPPIGDFRRICNVCRGDCTHQARHEFYHQLCIKCAELNLEKRRQTADLSFAVALVTGGRVRIGYATVLKLLRAGASVVTTTRFPADAALRYSREPDFEAWQERLLVVGPMELADIRLVEGFCAELTRCCPRIHILINNAAQTLTRPPGWHVRMGQLEQRAWEQLPLSARMLIRTPLQLGTPVEEDRRGRKLGSTTVLPRLALPGEGAPTSDTPPTRGSGRREDVIAASPHASRPATLATTPDLSQSVKAAAAISLSVGEPAALDDFPAMTLDESRQPLDLSGVNSWSRRYVAAEAPPRAIVPRLRRPALVLRRRRHIATTYLHDPCVVRRECACAVPLQAR